MNIPNRKSKEVTERYVKPVGDFEVFTFAYNEEGMLPLFLEHYSNAKRIVIYDNGSTDDTLKIARENKNVEVRSWEEVDKKNYNFKLSELKNTVWKESNAEWVIVCDMDELLCSELPDEATIVRGIGYNCASTELSKKAEQITHGSRSVLYDKYLAFKPSEIQEINYEPCAHEANPVGNLILQHNVLLHAKFVGRERIANHMVELQERGRNVSDEWSKQHIYEVVDEQINEAELLWQT